MTKYKYFGQLCKEADKQFFYGFRNSKRRFVEVWGEENVNWALKHGFLKTSQPMTWLGEPKNGIYYEYTKLGERIYRWNVYSLKDWFRYIKYKFFHKRLVYDCETC